MNNINIAIAGNVDSGKSTLIGVLTNNKLDNGRGLARNLILRNKHEKETGRTSTISLNYIRGKDKIYTLVDLAGHEKYLKTTMYGLTGMFIDYGIIVIGSNMGINKMTKEHIGIMLYLKIPFIIVVTKLDICPQNVLNRTKTVIKKLLNLPLFNKKSYFINNEKDLDNYFKIGNIETLIPILSISNKTGQNLHQLRAVIDSLSYKERFMIEDDFGSLMYIDSKFHVHGIGIVLAGTVKGNIKIGDRLWIGMIENRFIPIKVKSIHNNFSENVKELTNGEYGCIAINFPTKDNFTKDQINKGVIAFNDDKFKKNIVNSFEAEIKVLHHSTTIKSNYRPMIHCGQVRQCAKLELIDDNKFLRTGDNARVKFTFTKNPEYIEVGNTIFFRDGTTKGFGKVISLL
tara:strand:- start:5774 stop:6976 length:1203 start_codon:yes stop_codon:yes gene_type:complete